MILELIRFTCCSDPLTSLLGAKSPVPLVVVEKEKKGAGVSCRAASQRQQQHGAEKLSFSPKEATAPQDQRGSPAHCQDTPRDAAPSLHAETASTSMFLSFPGPLPPSRSEDPSQVWCGKPLVCKALSPRQTPSSDLGAFLHKNHILLFLCPWPNP